MHNHESARSPRPPSSVAAVEPEGASVASFIERARRRRRRRNRAVAFASGCLVLMGCFSVPSVRAQIGIPEAAVLARILAQNVEINGKLGTNNTLTKNYWNWHETELAAGYKKIVPVVVSKLGKYFKDEEIGYVEDELRTIEEITRKGKIAAENRDEYERAFSKVPDTPDALGQLSVDANSVYLLTKGGQYHAKIEEYRDELDEIAKEKNPSPHRAEQLARTESLLRTKIAACQADLAAITAVGQGFESAMANKFLKDEKAAQLQNADELRMWARSAKAPYQRDGTVAE